MFRGIIPMKAPTLARTSPLTNRISAPGIPGSAGLENTQAGCVYGHAAPASFATVSAWRSIHS